MEELRDASALMQDYRDMCTNEYPPMRTALGSGCCPTCGVPIDPGHVCRTFVCSVRVSETLSWVTGTDSLEECLCYHAREMTGQEFFEIELNGIGEDVEFLIYAI